MSRCFPFPPPGYEKKARTGDPDLLKKVYFRIGMAINWVVEMI
ncbi:hypothetical protein Pint_25505 [Pistacia integerrima]|uniref:Uncharacterized protein n=1 Tax=Pistacia integerrima TaxID=434235 RepID=A0ACC0YE62_9ROSI|nr:hypothetical protein Pint_25505 [Pistacia integerrima]